MSIRLRRLCSRHNRASPPSSPLRNQCRARADFYGGDFAQRAAVPRRLRQQVRLLRAPSYPLHQPNQWNYARPYRCDDRWHRLSAFGEAVPLGYPGDERSTVKRLTYCLCVPRVGARAGCSRNLAQRPTVYFRCRDVLGLFGSSRARAQCARSSRRSRLVTCRQGDTASRWLRFGTGLGLGLHGRHGLSLPDQRGSSHRCHIRRGARLHLVLV
mmetsp:Transcript_73599/g.146377  ORF Transcript_73599/g.146377 Transcript_73599/m.146377 type:complete len:213 (+) Transcript_73599:238-876(+)